MNLLRNNMEEEMTHAASVTRGGYHPGGVGSLSAPGACHPGTSSNTQNPTSVRLNNAVALCGSAGVDIGWVI